MEKKFKSLLSDLLMIDGEIERYHLSSVNGWPILDYDGFDDPLDLENFGLLEIGSKSITIVCGGDWQEPHKVILGLVGDELKVIKYGKSDFSEGIDLKVLQKKLSE